MTTTPTAARRKLLATAERHFLNDDIYDALIELDDAFEVGDDGTFWSDDWNAERLTTAMTNILSTPEVQP